MQAIHPVPGVKHISRTPYPGIANLQLSIQQPAPKLEK
jgi:hypothetical protein